MDVGTLDIIEDPTEPVKKRTGRAGGSNTPGGSDGGDPGGGDSGKPEDSFSPEIERFEPGISRIFTGFLLLVVLMTFGGLMAAYVVLATNNVAEWRPFDLPIQVWISTVIILASSIAYHLGKTAIDHNDTLSANKWLVITTILGAAFISSQILAWLALVARGLYIAGNPYAGFFYIMTAVHAVHVLGGITALGAVLLRSWHPTERTDEIERRQTVANVVGWYWHFMGIIWMVLFVLLGFWK